MEQNRFMLQQWDLGRWFQCSGRTAAQSAKPYIQLYSRKFSLVGQSRFLIYSPLNKWDALRLNVVFCLSTLAQHAPSFQDCFTYELKVYGFSKTAKPSSCERCCFLAEDYWGMVFHPQIEIVIFPQDWKDWKDNGPKSADVGVRFFVPRHREISAEICGCSG